MNRIIPRSKRAVTGAGVAMLLIGLTACQGPYQRSHDFDAAAYTAYQAPASLSFDDEIVFESVSNDISYGRDLEVVMVPATDYGWDTYRAFMLGQPTVGDDPRADAFRKTAITDTAGKYTITGLSPGFYIWMSDLAHPVSGSGLRDRFYAGTPREAMLVELKTNGQAQLYDIPADKKVTFGDAPRP